MSEPQLEKDLYQPLRDANKRIYRATQDAKKPADPPPAGDIKSGYPSGVEGKKE